MYRALLAALCVWIATVPAAMACRVGYDALTFAERPAPPEAKRYSSVVRVRLEGEPAPAPHWSKATSKRGHRVGSFRVVEIVRGPRLPEVITAYVKYVSSCSAFAMSPVKRDFDGYIVGELLGDDEGPYLSLVERHFPSGDWH